MLLEITLVFGGFVFGVIVTSWLAVSRLCSQEEEHREYKPLNKQPLEDYGPCCGTCAHWNSINGWCEKRGAYYRGDASRCEDWQSFDPYRRNDCD